MSASDEIRALLEARIDALRHRDAALANSFLDGHVVAFELAGPLQLPSPQATDNTLTQAWLDSFSEGPDVKMEQLAIHADETVAFCHSLNRVRGQRSDGQKIDVTMRSTIGMRKVGGEWKIIHGHTSLPR
jgi:ketosteroid isomerase-like protein